MIGGLFSSTVLTLVLVPAIYVTLKRNKLAAKEQA
jgi:Cu/Ag efflux pump CusA